MRARVNLRVEVFHKGQLVQTQEHHNLVVLAGLNLIRDVLNGDGGDSLSHIAFGTDDTAPAAGQTALLGEVFRDSFTSTTPGAAQLVIKYFLSSADANGNTLQEAGIFNAVAAGEMYARVVLSPVIAKTSDIAVTFTWTLTWTDDGV